MDLYPVLIAEFSVLLPCSGNNSGIAQLGIGLMIETRKGKPLNGTPLRLNLRKECTVRGECAIRAHDHHDLSTYTHSSVPAIIIRLIRCMPRTETVDGIQTLLFAALFPKRKCM